MILFVVWAIVSAVPEQGTRSAVAQGRAAVAAGPDSSVYASKRLADSASMDARWVTSRSDPESGVAFANWLAIPKALRGQPDSVRITFARTPNLVTWIATSPDECAVGAPTRADTEFRLVRDTILTVCARLEGRQTSRLVALVRRPPMDAPRIVASEPLTVRSAAYDLPAWLLTLISVGAGFLTGLFSTAISQRSEQKSKRELAVQESAEREAAHVRSIEESLAKIVVPELNSNRERLPQILAAIKEPGSGTRADSMYTTGNDLLLTRKDELTLVLNGRPRGDVLRKLYAQYELFGLFNDACDEYNPLKGAEKENARTRVLVVGQRLTQALAANTSPEEVVRLLELTTRER